MNTNFVRVDMAEQFGKLLSTRLLGMKVGKQIREHLFAQKDVVLDFTNVEILGNSFADEIAKLLVEIKTKNNRGKLRIIIKDPLYKKLLISRIKYRERQFKELRLEFYPLEV